LYVGTASFYSTLSNQLVDIIQDQRVIVYTDFVKDVAPIAIALRERGINSCGYHGKGMSSHDKLKAVENWCPHQSSIQVIYVTEYEQMFNQLNIVGNGMHHSFWNGC